MTYQDKLDKFTFLIPIFNLKDERLENFKFVLSKIKEITDNILVVEQVNNKRGSSEASKYTKDLGINYLPVKIRRKNMNKSVLINEATDFIKTEFIWVNDADCYLKFQKVIEKLEFNNDFIQPYELVKFINRESSDIIRSGKSCDIEFGKINTCSMGCMYGALSFLYRREAFIDIGGLDSRLDLYHEDTELCYRIIKSKKYDIQMVFGVYGIHLYHEYSNRDKSIGINGKKMITLLSTSMVNITDVLENYYRQLFLKSYKIEILTMFRGDFNFLENMSKFIDNSKDEIEYLDINITWVCNSDCSQFKGDIHRKAKINNRITVHQGGELGGWDRNDYFAGNTHFNIGDMYDAYFRKSKADILITLEDDVIPVTENAIKKLLLSLIEHPTAAIVCAVYESRHQSQYLNKDGASIGFLLGEYDSPLIKSIANTGLREMSWVGGGFTAYDKRVFTDINHLSSEFSSTSTIGWDILLSNSARGVGRSVLLNTDIFCDHNFN